MEQPIKKIRSYLLLKLLGAGSFASVYLAYCEKKNKFFAIKAISKVSLTSESLKVNFRRELEMLYEFKHTNLINFVEIVNSQNNYYLVLDFANGGSLSSAFPKKLTSSERPFEFAVTHNIISQIVHGLFYMKEKKAIHRDLKLDNILLHFENVEFTAKEAFSIKPIKLTKNNLAQMTVKIADFGFTRHLDNEDITSTICGTPLTMAPELMKVMQMKERNYTNKVDIWSLGIICYELVHGYGPFSASTRDELFDKVLAGVYKIDLKKMYCLEEMLFIEGLLKDTDSARMDWKDIENHPLIDKKEN